MMRREPSACPRPTLDLLSRLTFEFRWQAVLLLALALLPRLCALGRYATPDELAWVYRSVAFRQAILEGRWADTLVSGHPGVTTTWLGAAAISGQLALRPGDVATYEWITRLAWLAPDNVTALDKLATFLSAGRLAVVLANSLGVVGILALARPLLGRWAAFMATLLLALDPFVSGLSGLLHVDGLTVTWSTLSLLALARALLAPARHRSALRWSGVAGSAAALAILTKSPAVLLLPFLGLVIVGSLWVGRDLGGDTGARLKRALAHGGVWMAGLALTALVVLPALWAAPGQVASTISGVAERHVETAFRPTFFMGQVALDHGVVFYPVVVAFRLSPVVLVGSLLALWRIGRRRFGPRAPVILMLLLWVPLFLAGVSLAAKKFDRYALPVFPALALVAAAGWEGLRGKGRSWLGPTLIGLQALLLLSTVPYPLAAVNPLLGGARVARRVMTVGWGEGISAAGRWLAEQAGASETTAVSGAAPALAPFFPGRTLLFDDEQIAQADYVILSAADRQLDPAIEDQLSPDARLVHAVRFGGLDQAWVYFQPPPRPSPTAITDLPAPLSYSDRVQIVGVDASATSSQVVLTVRWRLLGPGERYTVHVAVRDAWNHLWVETETPLLNEVYFYPEHWSPGETPQVDYGVALPAGIPPAEYRVELSLFEAGTGQRLPLLAADGAFAGVQYTQEGVTVPLPEAPAGGGQIALPVAAEAEWSSGALALLGFTPPAAHLLGGNSVEFELFWEARTVLPDALTLSVRLGDEVETILPLSRYPSGRWRPNEVVREKYSLDTPPELTPGRYALVVAPTAADGAPLPGPAVALGEVEVLASDRLYELPADIPLPLDVRLGASILLRGADVETADLAPGEGATIVLYWQAVDHPKEAYTAFVHLVGPDGAIVAQDDRWPGGLPSNTWAPGQVVADRYDILLPDTAPLGVYQVVVGLYLAATGDRLVLTDLVGDGTALILPDDRLQLPQPLMVRAASG